MSGTKCKIAIVEDEKDLAEVYGLKLNMEGIEPVIINDSGEALSILKREKPALVLLDIMMPGMDGWELFGLMRRDKSLGKIRVYIWSNLAQKKDQEKAKQLGVDGFLIKSDYTPATLCAKVKELLSAKGGSASGGK